MGERGNKQRRLLVVTPGNLRQSHLYISQHYDFFPADCVGSPRKRGNRGQEIEIVLDGLDEIVRTDIGTNAKTGQPRGFFRGRTWVRRFFEHHQVAAGQQVALDRLDTRKYRMSVSRQNGSHEPSLKAAEFFAGIGLVRLALETQGWQIVYANDIDEKKAEMYRQNWPENDHLVVDDIHNLNADDIPDCDLFTASFPCNDLSIAGKWEGLNGKESSAFWGLMRILRELGPRRPPLLLIENVVGFLMSKNGLDFAQALKALNDLGYLVDAMILNAVHWTPQSRARLFIVARLDHGQPRKTFELATNGRPPALSRFINEHEEIAWDLQSLPLLPKPTALLADIVEDLSDDDLHWWSEDRVEYFMAQLSDRHAIDAERMMAGKRFTCATAFRRVRNGRSMAELRTDGIAGCLRTPRGGSGRQILFKAGRGKRKVRLLTARECARLQGVPDSYKIDVPLNQALFGFGDAVCVPAVEWIIKKCLTPTVNTNSPAFANQD